MKLGIRDEKFAWSLNTQFWTVCTTNIPYCKYRVGFHPDNVIRLIQKSRNGSIRLNPANIIKRISLSESIGITPKIEGNWHKFLSMFTFLLPLRCDSHNVRVGSSVFEYFQAIVSMQIIGRPAYTSWKHVVHFYVRDLGILLALKEIKTTNFGLINPFEKKLEHSFIHLHEFLV